MSQLNFLITAFVHHASFGHHLLIFLEFLGSVINVQLNMLEGSIKYLDCIASCGDSTLAAVVLRMLVLLDGYWQGSNQQQMMETTDRMLPVNCGRSASKRMVATK